MEEYDGKVKAFYERKLLSRARLAEHPFFSYFGPDRYVNEPFSLAAVVRWFRNGFRWPMIGVYDRPRKPISWKTYRLRPEDDEHALQE